LTSVTYPDGSQQGWERDYLGRIIAEIDVAGNRREYELDLLGNVTSVKEPDGNVRRFEYDAEENVIHAVDRNHDVRFRYKGMGKTHIGIRKPKDLPAVRGRPHGSEA
jgi:YD repeat-containing protein